MKISLICITALMLMALMLPACNDANSARSATTPSPSPYADFPVKRCINMGHTLESEYEGAWGYRIRTEDFARIKQAGFDTVRLPVRWDHRTGNYPSYTIDPTFMTRVVDIVSQLQSNGLGVIIDVHLYEDLIQNPKAETAKFLSIWEQIARQFQQAPDTVYFELLNEPTHETSMTDVNALYAAVMPIIRQTNPTRHVIIGGNEWNSIHALNSVDWPDDPYLVATFHDYGPHEFTHQGAEWSTPVMPMGRKWGSRKDIAELRDAYKTAANFQALTGLPILVGEFGVIDKVPTDERMAWLSQRRQTIEAAGYSWCVWDYAGAFKLYDTQAERWLNGALDALIPHD